jgi:glycerol-3-phosphate dehydrogenase (NAD(P)+)
MKISVLGCGRWGTFIAWYCKKIGHDVLLYGRENSRSYLELYNTRRNQYLELQEELKLTNSLEEAINTSDYIIISISAQELRGFAKLIATYEISRKKFILCMKGIEFSSGKRLTEVMREELGVNSNVAIWVGPGHVQDFVAGIPNCMIIDSDNAEMTKEIVQNLSSELIRFYYGKDLIGNEIGAAAKNVIGIAAGMLDGQNYSSLKGALMARGAREISRLIKAMSGNELTAYGLSHLGDYEATLFSEHSHNRRFGELFVKGMEFEKLAEGAATVEALMMLSKKYDVELPICAVVDGIVNKKYNPKEELINLFLRPVKQEF